MGTIFVLAALSAAVALIIRSMIRDKKQGRASCGGDCSRCRRCH